MSGTQLLRLRVSERLSAAVEEIFVLVEKTIAEYQEEAVRSKTEISQLKRQIQQLTMCKPRVLLFPAETHPSLQPCDLTDEQVLVLPGDENQMQPQVKEEQVDQFISPDIEAVLSPSAEDSFSTSETKNNSEPLPSTAAETVSVNINIDDQLSQSDGLLFQTQDDFVEAAVERRKPPGQKKSLKKKSLPLTHTERSHGNKAFKCFECNKVFVQKRHLVRHARVHTGEKPYSCDFCGKRFAQRFNRDVHLRLHTGEKPYYCGNCGESFAYRRHLRMCTKTRDKSPKGLRCLTCGKTFHTDLDLKLHMEVHESWKRHISEKQHGQEMSEESELYLYDRMASI